MEKTKDTKIVWKLSSMRIYERMFLIVGRRKLIRKTNYRNIKIEKFLTTKKTIVWIIAEAVHELNEENKSRS